MYSTTGKYRPMSTLIEVESVSYYNTHVKEVQRRAVGKISAQRKMDVWRMKQLGYTKAKVRIYNKEKIEQENKERYERIKKERGWSNDD